jgi:hypothetical protein
MATQFFDMAAGDGKPWRRADAYAEVIQLSNQFVAVQFTANGVGAKNEPE